MAENYCQPARFPIPAATWDEPHVTRLVIRRSKFVAQACQCGDAAMARGFVARIKELNADATHNCWAYVAGPPGDTASMGSSDDGEPRGSAGRPMLNVLLHCGIGQICVVVSRWFGGVKLGIGGLTRAYQDSTLENLGSLKLMEAISRLRWEARVGYEQLSRIKRALEDAEATILQETYGEHVALVIDAPEDRAAILRKLIGDASNGKCVLLPWQEGGQDSK